MSMTTNSRQVGSITMVNIGGQIVIGKESAALRNLVRELLSKGHKQILFNLGEVSHIDSTGLGTLVGAFTSVKNQNGELKLLNLTNKVRDIMQITKLYTVFDVLNYEHEALSFSVNRQLRLRDRRVGPQSLQSVVSGQEKTLLRTRAPRSDESVKPM